MAVKTFSLEALLDQMGVDYSQKTNRYSMCCPIHQERTPSSGFYFDTQRFYCFVCELSLTPVQFYAKVREIPYAEAEAELEKVFGIIPQQKKMDRMTVAKLRNGAELELRDRKHCLSRQVHGAHGEKLDKILWFYERGQIKDEQIEAAFTRWYAELGEIDAHTAGQDGTAGDRVHDRLQERVRNLPRARLQGGGDSVEAPQSDVTNRLPSDEVGELERVVSRGSSEQGILGGDGRPLRGEFELPEEPDEGSVYSTFGESRSDGSAGEIEEVSFGQTHNKDDQQELFPELE